MECQSFGAGATRSFAAIVTRSGREWASIFCIRSRSARISASCPSAVRLRSMACRMALQRCFPCMQRMTNDLAELFGALPSRPSNLKPRSFASVTHALKLSITDIFATCVPSLLVAAELGVAATALTTIKAVAEKMIHRMACLLCITDSTRPFTLPLYGIRKEIMHVEAFKDDMILLGGLPSVSCRMQRFVRVRTAL